ncbi:MAG: cytochrome c class I [Chitinophagia bacterium]|jgi:cytochrome c|nr:cytochrome c class I [Chitinophagia bacterium]
MNVKKTIMKQVLGTMVMVSFLIACGGGAANENKTEAATTTSPANALSSNPDYQKGLTLVGGSDCLTCHKVNEKNIGPAYKDVAAKYENTEDNVKMLAAKIIKGGAGNWGAIPMTPHPQVKEEDAEAMVKYILLLKK